jgi:hypothetical protein
MPAKFNPKGARTTFALPADAREKLSRLVELTGRSAVDEVATAIRDRHAALARPVPCRRCGVSVPYAGAERCVMHGCMLCYDCWDEHGKCGRD